LLHKVLADKTFADTKFPLKIVACNISKRSKFIFESGPLVDAVMASIAIPGLFAPVKVNGDLLVDGGIIEPVPVGTLVKMGIKKIIAVDTLPRPENILENYEYYWKMAEAQSKRMEGRSFLGKIISRMKMRFNQMFFPNILDIIVNSIQTLESAVSESDCQMADIVLRPFAVGVDWFELYKSEALIKKGIEEARRAMPDIKNLLKE
jgi:NTE family protein